jgi:RHS repeat-associated protein
VVATVKYGTDNSNPLTETTFAHNNYLGTPVLLTNSMASVTGVIERSVWGDVISNELNPNTQTNTEFGFTGHKWDENTSLTYLHARYMLNQNKVFLSHDPYSIDNFSSDVWLSNPRHQNSYGYSTNDPVNKIDPDGKISVEAMQDFSAKIYRDGHEGDDLCQGCRLVSVDTGGFGMKAGTYSVTYFGNFTEYAVVFRGSRGVNPVDWLAGNVPQYVGLSLDEYAARAYTGGFKNAMPAGTNITTGGDSKGGGHAISAGLANDLPAIVFNTAHIITKTNGLEGKEASYSNKVNSNLINGEFISKVTGPYTKPYVNTTVLPSAYTPTNYGSNRNVINLFKNTFSVINSMINNHSINNFKK